MNLRELVLISGAAAIAASSSASGDVLYDNIANPFLPLSGGGGGIEGAGGTFPGFSFAAAFTSPADYVLTRAEAVLRRPPGIGGKAYFSIYSDLNDLPGDRLTTLGAALVGYSSNSLFAESTPSSKIELLSGEQYWLVLSSDDFYGGMVIWSGGGPNLVPVASAPDSYGASGWSSSVKGIPQELTMQFQIDGTALLASAPEPRSWALWLTGLCAVVFVRFWISSRRHPSGVCESGAVRRWARTPEVRVSVNRSNPNGTERGSAIAPS